MSARDSRRRKAADLARAAWPGLHSSFWQRRLQALAIDCYLGIPGYGEDR